MRNSLRLAVLIAGASTLLGATFLVACSDDTSVNADGADAGQDGASDGPSPTETGPGDTGTDTSPPFDGGFAVDTFDGVVATTLCQSLARCCYGTPTPGDGGADGGTFDMTACTTTYGRLGFEGSNADSRLKDGGKVVVDQLNADNCVKKIQAMNCNLPGSEFKAIRTACFGAYSGSIAPGGVCAGSIECQQGFFCKTVGDAGTGVCTAIRAANGPCGDSDPNRADEACSYRAGGNTGNYCKFADLGTGVELDAGDWKCTAAGGMGTDCATSLWCEQAVCNASSVCETPNRYFDQACSFFIK